MTDGFWSMIMPRITFTSFLTIILLSSSIVLADPATLTRLDRKVVLGSQKLSLGLSTPEGKHVVDLERQSSVSPEVSLSARSSQQVEELPILYSGSIRSRSGGLPSYQFVAADYFRGKLKVNFIGRRGRLFEAVFVNGSQVGRLRHFPRSLEIPFEGKSQSVSKILKPVTSLAARSERAISLGKDLELGIDIDYDLYQELGSDVAVINAEILSLLNKINTIYKGQVGIRILLSSLNIWDEAADPYSNLNASERLKEFRLYTQSKGHIRGDLKHLITAVDINTPSSGSGTDSSIVGLAYVGVVCSSPSFAYGISERVSSLIQPIVTAHEIGHNFNCTHDQDTPSLMSPVLNSSLTTFSNASLDEIGDYVNGNDSCLADTAAETHKPAIKLAIAAQEKKRLRFEFTPSNDTAEDCSYYLYGAAKSSSLTKTFKKARSLVELIGSPQDVAVAIVTDDLTQRPSLTTYYRAVVVCGTHTALSKVIKVKSATLKGQKKTTVDKFLTYLQGTLD
jgi:hypothetical protein